MEEKCVKNINKALALAHELLLLADEGDAERTDARCSLLYCTLRDCGYRIKNMALSELERVKQQTQADGNGKDKKVLRSETGNQIL